LLLQPRHTHPVGVSPLPENRFMVPLAHLAPGANYVAHAVATAWKTMLLLPAVQQRANSTTAPILQWPSDAAAVASGIHPRFRRSGTRELGLGCAHNIRPWMLTSALDAEQPTLSLPQLFGRPPAVAVASTMPDHPIRELGPLPRAWSSSFSGSIREAAAPVPSSASAASSAVSDTASKVEAEQGSAATVSLPDAPSCVILSAYLHDVMRVVLQTVTSKFRSNIV
jgi:hypothetical protein